MTSEEWKKLKEERKEYKNRKPEFIKCSKCGKGVSYAAYDKTGHLIRKVGQVVLNAVHEAPKYNNTSGKSSKGKLMGYLCNSCCR